MYAEGQPYRYITGIDKKGRFFYEETTVTAVSGTKVYLANGKSIEYEPCVERLEQWTQRRAK